MVKQTYKLEIKVQDYECKYNFKTEVDMRDNLTREYVEKLLWFSELPLSITLDKIAMELFGEFGYNTCSEQEQMEILKQLSNEEN